MKYSFYITYIFLLLLFISGENSYAQRNRQNTSQEPAKKLTEAKAREAEFYFTEGQKYFMLEDYGKALALFNRSLEIDPNNATTNYKVAQILSRSQKEEDLMKAAELIDKAVRLQKGNKYFYLLAGSINSALLRFNKAVTYYEAMLAEVPGTEDYLFELAVIYLYQDKYNEAIEVYNRAEKHFGINEVSSIQKQKIYLQQKKVAEAIQEAEKLINAFPDEENYHMAYAEMLASTNKLPEAIHVLKRYLETHPDAGNAKFLLAGFYRDAGDEAGARNLILEIIDNPDIANSSKIIIMRTYTVMVEENRKKRIKDEATENFTLELYERLSSSMQGEGIVYLLGGDLFLILEDVHKARKLFATALKYDDSNYAVWQNILSIDMQLDQTDSILKNAEAALELFPNQGIFHYFNGYALNRKKRYREAAASLEQGKRLARNDKNLSVEINILLGDTYNASKDYSKSDQAYDAALAINPDNPYVLNNYSYYLALRKDQLEKAEMMAAKLTKDHPNNPSFLDTHAWVLFAAEKYKDARKIIERAIETGNANATHYEHYGDILFKLGDVDGAIKQWQVAKGMNPNNELINKKIADRRLYE
ncbi:MAG TPA: tetratricopeptide repeat protein [Cyclobacteriaceae bacterium]|nr:tetratricopeptide repeat protein [Cyclobacteriaceae bacterium]